METDCTFLKIENFDEEQCEIVEDFENLNKIKFGGILLSRDLKISFICEFCMDEMEHLEQLRQHLFNYHLEAEEDQWAALFSTGMENNLININNKTQDEAEEVFNYENLKPKNEKRNTFKGRLKDFSNGNKLTFNFDSDGSEDGWRSNISNFCEEFDKESLDSESAFIENDFIDTLGAIAESQEDNIEEKPQECDAEERRKQIAEWIETLEPEYEKKEEVTCDICFQTYKSVGRLKIHRQIHTNPKAFTCEICGATFPTISNFTTHRNRHLGIKPHQCTVCEKRFVATTELRIHMLLHTGERPFSCTECGRGFKRASILKSHLRRHNNERPFKCETCGKGFFDKILLNDHRISHSGERPFNCTICNKNFARRKALIEHKKIHSGEKKYVCEICNKGFKQPAGLYSHKKTHTKTPDKIS